MSYNTIVAMANDTYLQQRFIGCAAQEGIQQPDTWVAQRRWELCTDAQMEADYQYAIDTGLADIGKREDVVNDAKILSVIQAANTA